ncbi:peptidoglycan-binding domain-containing protein [Kiloniella majae]|uniref:peptidoglycan-binding domain-containing protein n=1 Tax=Kiloniella majae TaxID=1938558 RepID=UPI000A277AB9|nr:peptidoglycan-binding domain-containing protein [Kiloniella majae]
MTSGKFYALLITIAVLLTGCSTQQKPVATQPTSSTTPSETTQQENPGFLAGKEFALLEAREYPWSTLGRLNVAGRHFCNGIMVGARKLLAPASCLYDLARGRWFQPNEIVFVAGYQRDDSTVSSVVKNYQIAQGFTPENKSLKSLLNNWALIQLTNPLGNYTGWVGVTNQTHQDDLIVEAGYRRGWEHMQALFPFCNQHANRATLCPAQHEGPLNRFSLTNQGLVLAPSNVIADQTYQSWNLSPQPVAPQETPYITPRPQNSVQRLLVDLKYLGKNTSDVRNALLQAQQDLGITQTGKADSTTLYYLLKRLNALYSGKPVS